MKNFEILSQYNRRDLRKLAKGKISEIVGINSEKVLINLSKILGNYESIRNNIEFRKPPAHTILEVLFDAPNRLVKFEDLKPIVIKKIKEYQKLSKDMDFDDSAKNYHLYAKVLNTAWEYEGDLLPAEANILRVLRKELNISKKDHQYIMAHPKINRLIFNEDMYRNEIEYLSREGIILIYKKDNDDYFVLSEETVESLNELWGIELEPDQFLRLLNIFNNIQLSKILKSFELPCYGKQEERINRIFSNELKPSKILYSLSNENLSSYLKIINLPPYGKKEERVLKIIDHFKSNKDLEKPEPEKKKEVVVEEKLLSEEKRIDLLSNLNVEQLYTIVEKLDLPKSGPKKVRIDKLVNSRYNIRTILNCLKIDDIKDISNKIEAKSYGPKSDQINNLISYYREIITKESTLPTKQLFNHYDELSCQDKRIYPKEDNLGEINTATIAIDFERVTKYIFKNIFKLETKTQRFGKEEPDGTIIDDEGNIFFYECKTVLNPPYTLPIAHRLQIRNYIQKISGTKYEENFKGYIIISHSFSDNIRKKLQEIESPIDVPISVIEANDLAAFASKWKIDYPTDTFPIKQIVKNWKIATRDFEKVLR